MDETKRAARECRTLHMCSHTWLPARQEQRTGLRELLQWLALDCVGSAVAEDEDLTITQVKEHCS